MESAAAYLLLLAETAGGEVHRILMPSLDGCDGPRNVAAQYA